MNVVQYELANAQRLGARDEQQDAAGFIDSSEPVAARAGVLGVLADGMGGLTHGAAVAQLTVRTILDAYRNTLPDEPIPAALRRAVGEANEAVRVFLRANGIEGQSGSTVIAAVLHGLDLYWISAGDSRGYLVRLGRTYRLTVDHTVGEDRAHNGNGAASRAGAASGVDPDALTSFVGLPTMPRVDVALRPFRLRADDCVILASDGLYRTLTESEIGASLSGNLRTDCDGLVDQVVARRVQDQDNVTVIALAPRVPGGAAAKGFGRRIWRQ